LILELGERLARGELSLEAHGALLDNLKAYFKNEATEQMKKLEELEVRLERVAAQLESHER
jgi:hypothetical protein